MLTQSGSASSMLVLGWSNTISVRAFSASQLVIFQAKKLKFMNATVKG